MTHTSTEQELYEKWRDDYALKYEPNYDEHLNADCKAAFIAGMQAARRAPVATYNHREFANAQKAQPAEFEELMWQNIASLYTAAPQPPEAGCSVSNAETVEAQMPEMLQKLRISAKRDGELGRDSARTDEIEQKVLQLLANHASAKR